MEGDFAQALKPGIADISIHTLRMEGDVTVLPFTPIRSPFQSTPSAWRVTIKLNYYEE